MTGPACRCMLDGGKCKNKAACFYVADDPTIHDNLCVCTFHLEMYDFPEMDTDRSNQYWRLVTRDEYDVYMVMIT